jgi:hypothetical protein
VFAIAELDPGWVSSTRLSSVLELDQDLVVVDLVGELDQEFGVVEPKASLPVAADFEALGRRCPAAPNPAGD